MIYTFIMWQYLVLGILQGIFEWIPISSEGVIVLASKFFTNQTNLVDIALFLHLGTMFATLIYFRKDWYLLFLFKNKQLFRFLTISTTVSLILGYFLYNLISNLTTGSLLLILMGFALLITSYFNKSNKSFNLNLDMKSNKLALITGLLQGLAVIPGLSRSGSTIMGLSLSNLTPPQILKVSYMMSTPVILASSAYLLLKNPTLIDGWPSLITSFIVGIISLAILIKISQKINFSKFTLIYAILCFIGGGIGLYFGV